MLNKKQTKELETGMTNLVKGATHSDDSLIVKFLGNTMTSIKTRKSTGNKQAVTNACFIVRLANHVGVKHELIDRYYEAGNTSGINSENDINALVEISGKLIGLSCSHATDYKGMTTVATAFVESQGTKPKASTESLMPKINFGTKVTLDDVEDEEDEDEEATATETSFVLDEFNLEVVKMIQSVSVEEIAQAKEVLHKTNKNGEGYEMCFGKKVLTAYNLGKAIEYDTQLFRAGADILCIAPKRQKKWTATNGTEYKTRTWFPELCGASDYNKAKKLTERMTAYVILNSKRNFWTARFAWSVSDDFREAWRALIGINEEVADSKVIGGKADSWHQPLVKNDWTPTNSSSKMTDDEFYNLDITSLDTL